MKFWELLMCSALGGEMQNGKGIHIGGSILRVALFGKFGYPKVYM